MISHSHRKPCAPKCDLDGAQLQNVEIVDVGISIGIDIACSAADDRDVELEPAHGFESRRYLQAGPCAAPFQQIFTGGRQPGGQRSMLETAPLRCCKQQQKGGCTS